VLSAIRSYEISIVVKNQSYLQMASSVRNMLQHSLELLCNGGRALIDLSFGLNPGALFQTPNIDCWAHSRSGARGKPGFHNGLNRD
jgi:hypothetical protein